MLAYARHLPVLIVYLLVTGLHVWMWRSLLARTRSRRAAHAGFAALMALMSTGFALGFNRVTSQLPEGSWIAWVRAAAMLWALLTPGLCALIWVWQISPGCNPVRRRLLRSAGLMAATAPAAVMSFGAFVERSRIRPVEVDLKFPALAGDLRGLRIAQLTDIHFGPFLSERELTRAVDMANDFRPHIAVVTGDLITERGNPLEACLRLLSRLRASDGIYGCLGNHEGYARLEAQTAALGGKLGIPFLRNQSLAIRFGAARLNLAGVDYQKMGGPYLRGSELLAAGGAFNILLSHNPDVFPVAAGQGHDLVLAGHTHGGQIHFEIIGLPINVAEFYTPFVYGAYRQGRSALYVSGGIGTVGIPVRIGAVPEVSLIRLTS